MMTDIEKLRQEIEFLDAEIRGLKSRIGSAGNAVQHNKLDMLTRLRDRCARSLTVLVAREKAA